MSEGPKEVVTLLLEAPDGHLDDQAKALIREWDEVPKAAQILKTLDHCAYFAYASGFTMRVLDIMYQNALKAEGRTEAEMKIIAEEWRQTLS